MSELTTFATELAALAVGLALDAGIGLEVAPGGWSWDPLRRVLRVSAEDLTHRGAPYCAGIIAHEVSHAFISRYLSFSVDFVSAKAARHALNGIEDPRVDRWIARRYPGAAAWQEVGKRDATSYGPGTPYFAMFVLECAMEGDREFAPSTKALPEPVVRALELSREARRRYCELAPPTELGAPVTDDVLERYRREVWPARAERAWLPPKAEQRVQVSAFDALQLAVKGILPHAEPLYLRDRTQLARWLTERAARAEQARRALEAGQAGAIVGEAMRAAVPELHVPPWAVELAGELLDGAASGQVPAPMVGAGGVPRGPGAPGERPPLPRVPLRWAPAGDYDRARAKVADQIELLVRHLEELLRPRKRSRSRAGYPSGRRVDLKRLVAYEANPRKYGELWVRTTIPDRRDTAFGLLVDLSGSMRGAKADNALLGTVLLAETLVRLDVPFTIDGFQDVLVPLVPFGEGLTQRTRKAIAELPLEIGGARPDGNNQPSYNDDGPCLAAFADKLLAWPSADHVLIVVSDGYPEGLHSNAADLHRAVGSARERARLIGLGLGPDTDHVKEFYPEAVSNVEPEALAHTIGNLLESALLESRGAAVAER